MQSLSNRQKPDCKLYSDGHFFAFGYPPYLLASFLQAFSFMKLLLV